ncbi:MAG TPA: 5'-nucleotidase C-terminal domain-containing protein [Candidatus Udaeobacter sp.]|jgi:2',3'-cyclic-nucleotide 2'-phosphodiesterase/3'-nucleotidase|nr:5'-nucleotidase C-terminal domain-containing protein [Candidatus Udaeobacter sp.]
MRSRALLLLLGLLAAVPARAESLRLTLLHTSDLHGALDGWDYLADRPAARGLTRIATLVRRARSEGTPTLLVDAGDAIQGGVEVAMPHVSSAPVARADPMMSAMSAIGYDAMAVGNHEFDFGQDAIEQARRAARFPWLSANLLRDGSPLPVFAPSVIKILGGARVGIVGLTTPATAAFEDPENLAGWHFVSPLEAAQLEVGRLRETEHCDVVVVLAHTGLERDSLRGAARAGETPDENWGLRLATEVPGADIVILGHTHEVIPWRRYGNVLVTQAGRSGEQLGRIDLTLERDGARWKLINAYARMIAVTDSVPDDSALTALAEPYHAAARDSLSRVVGTLSQSLDSGFGRATPNPAWRLVAEAMRQASGADIVLTTLPDTASRIPAGPVRMRDVRRLYPYDNTLDVVELTGAELRGALEQSAEAFNTYTGEAGRPLFDFAYPSWNYDAALGVRYAWDLTQPPGHRVVALSIGDQPLAADRTVKVALSSYRANGAGGYESLKGARRVARVARPIPDLIADLLSAERPHQATPEVDPWRIQPDYAALPERDLIDRLVRQGVLTLDEMKSVRATEPALQGQAATWLARAFGWGHPDRPPVARTAADSVDHYAAALAARDVIAKRMFRAGEPVSESLAVLWSERIAEVVGYENARRDRAVLRRSLFTGVHPLTLTGQTEPAARLLGMISNLRYPTLRVIETSDVHGFILPGARERRTRRPVGGSAALASWVRRLRAENPEGTILLDGGDWFQGTMISNLQFGRPIVEQMNLLGYTAAAIGNHDFDWGVDTLARRIGEMRFAALGANCVERKSGRLPRYARADTVVVRRGVRVGILGLCFRETPTVTLPKNVAHLRFEDDSATAARRVPELRRRGHAQVVLSVGHIPAETDSTNRAASGDLLRLARGVHGVDAWLGGHSHNNVVDAVGGVPVMIPGAHAEVVGVIDLTFDPLAGRVIEHREWLQPTYSDILPPDSAMAARVTKWNAEVAPLAAQPVGRAVHRLTRSGENTIGYLVTDAMRAASGADVALTNTGGLRADLPEGSITHGAIYEVMPFDNTIVTLDMNAGELRQVFEEGLRVGRVLQVSGIRLSFDLSRPQMQRVVSLTQPNGKPLDPNRTLKVAVNNFIASGGDGYTSFARGRNLVDTRMALRDAMEAFVRTKSANGGAIDYGDEGRVTRIGGRD